MKFILLFFFTIFFIICNAQRPIQSVSGELGKNGLLINVIYDYQFSKSAFGFRGGLGASLGRYVQGRTITVGGYKLFGKRKEFLEMGIDLQYLSVVEVSDDQRGIPTIYPDYSINTLYPSFNFGYRKVNNKSIFRIGLAPGFTKDDFIPGGYISLGIKW